METDLLDSLIPVEAEPHRPTGWLRALDMIGMAIAPLSISLPFFFLTFKFYQSASSTGTNYTDTLSSLFGALVILIGLGLIFWNGVKLYLNHQETRENVKIFRRMYSGIILGSFLIYFMFFSYFFLRP